ncbi:hypothetical protein Dimus_008039, partial [Dionaea muscipula]
LFTRTYHGDGDEDGSIFECADSSVRDDGSRGDAASSRGDDGQRGLPLARAVMAAATRQVGVRGGFFLCVSATAPARHGDGDDAGSGFAMTRKTERRRVVEARRGSAANSSRVAALAGLQERGQPHTAVSNSSNEACSASRSAAMTLAAWRMDNAQRREDASNGDHGDEAKTAASA